MVQRTIFATLFVVVMSCSTVTAADDSSDESLHDDSALRDSFGPPLQLEFLMKGLTPRNAQIASRFALDHLVECWISDRNLSTRLEQRIITIRLGGKKIVTYDSPCIDEFLTIVGEIP